MIPKLNKHSAVSQRIIPIPVYQYQQLQFTIFQLLAIEMPYSKAKKKKDDSNLKKTT